MKKVVFLQLIAIVQKFRINDIFFATVLLSCNGLNVFKNHLYLMLLGSDSDSNHGDMWEEQQIRKAVSIPQVNIQNGEI